MSNTKEEAEKLLKEKFGGYIGETKVYITDKDLLIKTMIEFANRAKTEEDTKN